MQGREDLVVSMSEEGRQFLLVTQCIENDSKTANRRRGFQVHGDVRCRSDGRAEGRKRIVVSTRRGGKQISFLAKETKIQQKHGAERGRLIRFFQHKKTVENGEGNEGMKVVQQDSVLQQVVMNHRIQRTKEDVLLALSEKGGEGAIACRLHTHRQSHSRLLRMMMSR